MSASLKPPRPVPKSRPTVEPLVFTSEMAYAELPRRVRVGCYDFHLEPMTKREAEESEAYGMCEFSDLKIVYRIDLSVQALGNTILHELLHAIHWAMGLPTGTDGHANEEEFTNRGANGLHQVWRDNQELISWLNKCFVVNPNA